MDWTPQEDILKKVLEILKDSFVPDSIIQRNVQENLRLLQLNPEFCNYMLLICDSKHLFDDKTRALAGLIMKNNIVYFYSTIPPYVKQHMQQKCLNMLTDTSKEVRISASVLINVMVQKEGIQNTLMIIPYIIDMLSSSNNDVCETGMRTLVLIMEDYLHALDYNARIDDVFKSLLSKFIEMTGHGCLEVRKWAFRVLNECLQKHYHLIRNDFDSKAYLDSLMAHANDENHFIILLVLQGFVVFINNQDETILPAINEVICYMLSKSMDADSDVAMQACEFWLSLSKLPSCVDILRGHLQNLIPILLRNMRYSQYELFMLKDTLGKDLDSQDSSQDIKPFIKASEDDDDPDLACTLRKCSAASLDSLALQYEYELAELALPLIIKNLESEDMLLKECGILAFGAIADGCFNSLIKLLPELIPLLLHCMEHQYSLIRSITCWTLSRYTRCIVHDDKLFLATMKVLLEHSLDENKRVQRAAISSFCFFQEEAKMKLIPYTDVIAQAFVIGFDLYKTRSLYLLYDAIGVLAQGVGLHFTSVLVLLMPRLLSRFNALDDYNNPEEFLAICECLSSVILAVGEEFVVYAPEVYPKCTRIITENNLGDNFDEEYDKNLVSGAMDLLVALCASLKTEFAKVVVNVNFIDQLYGAIQDKAIQVRQPALALLGELVKHCFPYINDHIHVFIPVIIENLDKRYNGACNNAAWVISKLCVAMETTIGPYATNIVEHVVEILQHTDTMQTMYKTVALTFCTLGLVCPSEVSPFLRSLMRPLCSTIRNVGDCEDKLVGFRGLCEVVMRNPDVFANDFIYFCDAVASWHQVDPELRKKISYMINEFKQHVGDNWNEVYGTFPPLLKERLAILYGV